MATAARATTPQSFEAAAASQTPPSVSGPAPASHLAATTTGDSSPNLLRPLSSHRDPSISSIDFSPKSDKGRYTAAFAARPLTGAAAMSDLKRRKAQYDSHTQQSPDSRHTSPNPAVEAMQSLMGGGGISRPTDAPAPDKLSEPLRKAAEKISIPDTSHSDSLQVSPVSMASFGTLEGSTGANTSMTATTNDPPPDHHQQYVAEPAQMTEGEQYAAENRHLAVADGGNKAFSYPGPPPQQAHEPEEDDGPARGMSYPGIGQSSPKSPGSSSKRHKCPYCETDFTRHHNLKSHLLTHSQEKPYICQTCQQRFRRLHDLKRHSKLHTGERPHRCEKCHRRFARGDALARHKKGSDGCAGRRSSFGGGDGDYDDSLGPDGMDGVEFTGDDDDALDEHGRRGSEPNRKRAHLETPQDLNRQVYRQHSSTYPPPASARPHGSSVSSMAPPTVVHPGSSAAASPQDMSGQPSPVVGSSVGSSYYNGPGQAFAQQGVMTESPKPLSPGQPNVDQHRLSITDASSGSILRNRSPSLTTQFQQQHFGRGSGGRTPPLPPAQFAPGQTSNASLPVLPPISGQSQARSGLPGALPGGLGPSMLHHQQLPPGSSSSNVGGVQGSNPGSLSSHGRSSGSSMRDVLNQDPGDIWAYVRNLEQRFSRMQEEYELRISRLQEELIQLRGQVSAAASYSSDMQRPY